MAKNIKTLSVSPQTLYRLSCGINRDTAKAAGFYDGRFASRTEPTKKQILHLKLRKEKYTLKKEF
jgi:hypothetical protein